MPIVLSVFSFFTGNQTYGQSLACNNHINISVGEVCEVSVEPDMLLEGGGPYDPADYNIVVTTESGIEVANPIVLDVSISHTQTFIATITEIATNNSCWTSLTIEDKLDPIIDCQCPPGAWISDPQCQLSCAQVNRYLNGSRGAPSIIENCGEVDAVFDGASFVELECGVLLVTQNWHVVQTAYPNDIHYYNASCTNEFYFYQPGLDEIDCPDAKEYSCEEYGTEGLTHPDNTGYPEIDNVELIGEINPNCNINAGFSDQTVEACELGCSNNEKLVRTWTIIDWCAAETAECIQIIKTVDIDAPTVKGEDFLVSTGPWACSADVIVPDPLVHDNCDYNASWYIAANSCGALITDVNGNVNSDLPKIRLENVPKGYCEVILAAVDCCGNVGYDTITLEVKDLAAPVVVATQNIIVGLTSSGDDWDGTAKLGVESIDNGSHDNCSPHVFMEIRREDDPCDIDGNLTYSNKIPEFCDPWYDNDDHDYGQYVKFCCNDLTEYDSIAGVAYGMVKVWVRVWDDANMDGIYGSYEYIDLPGNEHDYCNILDNYNELWINVRVEDKAPISLICPPDITMPCDWSSDDLSITGTAVASGTCDHPTPEYVDWPEVHCGEGVIHREWFVPGSDYLCVQRITIEPVDAELTVVCPDYNDFNVISGNPDISFFDPFTPNHVTISCESFEFPEPFISGGACVLVGVSESIDTFWFELDACYKAVKTYEIVDWCTGQQSSCEFVVSVLDDEAPLLMCKDTCFGVNDFWDEDDDGIYCELTDDVEVEIEAQDFGDCPSDWIKWVVAVDLWSNGTVELEYSSFLAPNDPYYIAPSQSNGKGVLELDKDDISAPWAIHRLEWKGFDGCGNVSQCVQFVEVTDKKAPTPYCVNTSSALMEGADDPILEIKAKDFNLGSFDNCDSENDLGYYLFDIKPIDELIGQVHCFRPVIRNNIPCVPDTIMVDGVVHIKIEEVPNCTGYENGFFDVGCITDAIQRWDPVEKTTSIRLRGTHWCGVNELNVWVFDQKLNSNYCTVEFTIHGDACDGGVIDEGDIYGSITTKDNFWLEGAEVSAMDKENQMSYSSSSANGYAFDDLEAFQSYIVSAEKDGDDMNGVSTYDVILLNRHVLKLEVFDEVESYIAGDINNDDQITAIDILELRKLIIGVHSEFQLQDSWSIIPMTQLPGIANPFEYDMSESIQYLMPENMQADFRAIKIGDINRSAFPNLNNENVEERSSSNYDIQYRYVDGIGYEFYFDRDVKDFHGFQFELEIKGSASVLVDGRLNLTDGFTHQTKDGVRVSYNVDQAIDLEAGEILFLIDTDNANEPQFIEQNLRSELYADLIPQIYPLRSKAATESQVVQLYQNQPNPFDNQSMISFEIPEAMDLELKFHDINGRLLNTIKGHYNAGLNSVHIDRRMFGISGVIIYELSGQRFKLSKRMILID